MHICGTWPRCCDIVVWQTSSGDDRTPFTLLQSFLASDGSNSMRKQIDEISHVPLAYGSVDVCKDAPLSNYSTIVSLCVPHFDTESYATIVRANACAKHRKRAGVYALGLVAAFRRTLIFLVEDLDHSALLLRLRVVVFDINVFALGFQVAIG